MSTIPSAAPRWRPPHPTWGTAIIAMLGCALPLSLGLLSGHPGFLWAAVGAFQAARANPLHRFGMPRMMLLILLGACGSGFGYWVAREPVLSLVVFASMGFLLAWLQRFGTEAAKLGLGVAVCVCLGQGLEQAGEVINPMAVSMLFCLGGLWLALLAFGLRGLHGLRMWPYTPRVRNLLKVLRRHARHLQQRRWRLHALSCTLILGLAGLIVSVAHLSHGYWLTLSVLAALQLNLQNSLKEALQTCLLSLTCASALILLGHSLQSPNLMVAIVLPLIMLSRAIQANGYPLFMLQSTACCLLLAESLSLDWDQFQPRLINSALGVALAMLFTLLIHAGLYYRQQRPPLLRRRHQPR